MPKKISKQERSDIKDAVNSIPSLIIEHVSFSDSSSMDNENTNEDPKQKYVLSHEKTKENIKKRNTILVGVGIILSVLIAMWILNVKTFFFDVTRTTSKEAQLLKTMKENFNSTVNLVSPTVATSTASSTSELSASSTENISSITEALKNLFTDTPASVTTTTSTEEILTSTTTTEISATSTPETNTTSTATSTQ